jgi:hypothetical protein
MHSDKLKRLVATVVSIWKCCHKISRDGEEEDDSEVGLTDHYFDISAGTPALIGNLTTTQGFCQKKISGGGLKK